MSSLFPAAIGQKRTGQTTQPVPPVTGSSIQPMPKPPVPPTQAPAPAPAPAAPKPVQATPAPAPAPAPVGGTTPKPATLPVQTPTTDQPATPPPSTSLSQWTAMGSLLGSGQQQPTTMTGLPSGPVGMGSPGQTTQPIAPVSDAPLTPTPVNVPTPPAMLTPAPTAPQTQAPMPAAPTLQQSATKPVGGGPAPATTNAPVTVGGITADPSTILDQNGALIPGSTLGDWQAGTGWTAGSWYNTKTGQFTSEVPPEVQAWLDAAKGTTPATDTGSSLGPLPTTPVVGGDPLVGGITDPAQPIGPDFGGGLGGPTGPSIQPGTVQPTDPNYASFDPKNLNNPDYVGVKGYGYYINPETWVWANPDGTMPMTGGDNPTYTVGPGQTGGTGSPTVPVGTPDPDHTSIPPGYMPDPNNPGHVIPIPPDTTPPPGGETTPPATNPDSNLWDLYNKQKADADKQWGQIESDSATGLARQLQDVQLQQSLNARRSNEMNALGGGGAYGGAQAAGQAQAQLGGQQLANNAIVDQNKRMIAARQTYLQGLMDSAAQTERLATTSDEAQKARDLQLQLQQMVNQIDVLKQAIDSGGGDPAKIQEILKNLGINP